LFDVTSQDSFDSVDKWLEEVQKERGEDATVYLVGNKIDLEEGRKVTRQIAEQTAERIDGFYYELSAKTSDGVSNFFAELGDTVSRTSSDSHNDSVTLDSRRYSGKIKECCA
jgi:GTPase SAR1 family protein